jgi:two-component system OmpR family sensor kinase
MHEDNLEELDRISDIIHNLLTVNALIQPERIPFGPVDLGKIARHAVERFGPLAKKKSVRIRVTADRAHSVWGNHAALEQIASNLVKNAVQHTDRGHIAVRIAPASLPDYMEFSVTDTGSGIPRENLAKLFQPFFRGDPARTRKSGGGSGLGLSIVSELVKLHHGHVSIRSTPGVGTSVRVLFPCGTDTARARLPLVEREGETAADFTKKSAASA